MKQGQKRTRTTKLDTSIDAEIAAAESKLKTLREQKKENDRKYLERNQKAILALLSEYELDRVPVAKWQKMIIAVHDILVYEEVTPIIAEPAKFEEVAIAPEQEAA